MNLERPAPEPTPVANLASSGLVVASLTAVSRVSGLARDVVFSYFFGAGVFADAFFVAFRIPNFFRRLLAEGAFAQAFVPVLAEYQTRHTHEELQTFVRYVTGNYLLVLLVVCTFGSLAAPWIVQLFTLGGWRGTERVQIASTMLHIMFPYLGLISLAAFAGAILNTYDRFAIPAASPILLNLVLIVATATGVLIFESPLYVIAIGVLVAGLLQLTVNLPSLTHLKLLVMPKIKWRDQGVRKMLNRIGPSVYAASAGQINILVGTIIASQCILGSVSWLYYADRLLELPIGMVAIALQTVLLPQLSRIFQSEDRERFSDTLDWGYRLGLLLSVPASAALLVLATPLIATIFLHGQFDSTDLQMVALALQVFALGVIPLTLTRVAAPAFFARGDTQTPFRYATIGIATNICLSLTTFQWLSFVGIAYATSVAAFVNCLLLCIRLNQDGSYRRTSQFRPTAVRIVISTALMSAVLVWLQPDPSFWTTAGWQDRIGYLAALVAIGFSTYIVASFVLGMRPRHILERNH